MLGYILLGVLTLEVVCHFLLKRAEHKRIEKNKIKEGVNEDVVS